MKSQFLRAMGIVAVALVLLGPAPLIGLSAQAQSRQPRRVIIVRRPIYRPFYRRHWDPWRRFDRFDRFDDFRYQRYVFSNPEKAFSQGHEDGFKVGKGDAKNHRTYKPERSHYYSDAGFGNYGEVYRRGFARGYAEGWRAQDLGR